MDIEEKNERGWENLQYGRNSKFFLSFDGSTLEWQEFNPEDEKIYIKRFRFISQAIQRTNRRIADSWKIDEA